MNSIVIAPHPDDELLGVGGTLLRRKAEGGRTAWLIATGISTQSGWAIEKVDQRASEIEKVGKLLQFDEVYKLNLPTTQMDQVPIGTLISHISKAFSDFQPAEVFLPHFSDIHTDHQVLFKAVVSCTKWFRYPSVKRVLCYETLSETEFAMGGTAPFRPNYFVDISDFLAAKMAALQTYSSELGKFPFPRSIEAVNALATLRGATSGYLAAEAFELLRERN